MMRVESVLVVGLVTAFLLRCAPAPVRAWRGGEHPAAGPAMRLVRTWRAPFLEMSDQPRMPAALSPDGTRVAWGVPPGDVQLADVATGKPGALLPGPAEGVLSFSADGRELIDEQPSLRIRWGLSRTPVTCVASNDVGALDLEAVKYGVPTARSLDGSLEARLVYGVVDVCDGRDGQAICRFELTTRGTGTVAFRPGVPEVLAGGFDGSLELFDVARRARVLALMLPDTNDQATGLSFSRDGLRLIVSTRRGAIYQYALTASPPAPPPPHAREPLGALECLTPASAGGTSAVEDFAIVGHRLVTLVASGALLLADLETGRTLSTVTLSPSTRGMEWYRLTRVRGEDRLLISAGNEVFRCDVGADSLALSPLPLKAFSSGAANGGPAGALVKVLDDQHMFGTYGLVDPATGAVRSNLPGLRKHADGAYLGGGCSGLALSADGARIAAASMDAIAMWDPAADRVLWRVPGDSFNRQLSLEADALAVCAQHQLAVRDASTGALRWERAPPADWFYRAPELSPDGTRVAVIARPITGSISTIEVHDAASGRVQVRLDPRGVSRTMHWSADGTLLVVLSHTGAVRCFDTRSWRELPWSRAVPAPRVDPKVDAPSVIQAPSPGGGLLASVSVPSVGSSAREFVALVPSPDATPHVSVGPCPDGAAALLWLDRELLVAGSGDGHLHVYDALARRQVQDLPLTDRPDAASSIELEPGGRALIVRTQRGALYRVALR